MTTPRLTDGVQRRAPNVVTALILAGHPLQTLAISVGVAVCAVLSGRPDREVGLVLVTVLLGRLTASWVNDVADRDRDRLAGRHDKPVAMGWVEPGTVTFVTACTVCLLVPLSIASGTEAGIAHLAAVAVAWLYSWRFKMTRLSWLPWAVSFALYPAYLSYGGWGGGMHGAPPTIAVTVVAGLLGIGVHVADALPDLVADNKTGVNNLPLRIAKRLGAAKLLYATIAYLALVGLGLVVTGLTVGLRQ